MHTILASRAYSVKRTYTCTMRARRTPTSSRHLMLDLHRARTRTQFVHRSLHARLMTHVYTHTWSQLVPPVIAFTDVAFSYSGKKKDYLYKVRLKSALQHF